MQDENLLLTTPMAVAKMGHRSLDFQFCEEKEGKKEGNKDGEEIKDTTSLTCAEESSGNSPETAALGKDLLTRLVMAGTQELRFAKILIIS